MLDIDLLSMMNEELLAESWSIELGDYIIDIAWSPEGSKLAAATVEGSVFLIDDRGDSAQTGTNGRGIIGQHAGGANSLSWRHDGREFATAGHDGLVKCWDAESGQLLSELHAGDPWVAKAVYNPRRNVLATAAGRHLKVWNDEREHDRRSRVESRWVRNSRGGL